MSFTSNSESSRLTAVVRTLLLFSHFAVLWQ